MSIQLDDQTVFTKETAHTFTATVIECPDCAFEFSASQDLSDKPGIYECPVCRQDNLEVLIKRYEQAHQTLRDWNGPITPEQAVQVLQEALNQPNGFVIRAHDPNDPSSMSITPSNPTNK